MKNRRDILKTLSVLGLAAAAPQVLAQAAQPAPASSVGPDLIAARAIPWENGRCEFCEMPLQTPAPGAWQGRTFSPGFFEQTYSQIALREPLRGRDALHFESIGCMINHAWVHGIRDGHGTTFYVSDRGLYDPAQGRNAVRLLPARLASFLWGERRGWVVMDAKVAAFNSRVEAEVFARRNPDLGRTYTLNYQVLLDLAPLPTMNLVNLLARHSGLLR